MSAEVSRALAMAINELGLSRPAARQLAADNANVASVADLPEWIQVLAQDDGDIHALTETLSRFDNTSKAAGPHEPSHEARAEIGAYHRWAAKATTGGRPFRMEHASPDDFPDGVPAGVEFADWVWVGPDGDLVKAYEPWWPRDSKGKWIKRASFAGLEDKIRALHDKHMAERDRLDARIAEHGTRLRAAEARGLTGDTSASAEAATHRARIAELRTQRDKAEQRRKDSASTVLAAHEAEQRKAQRDANRATVGTMEDIRTTASTGDPVADMRNAYARVARPGEWASVADLRDATPHLSRAEQDAALRRLERADDANVVPESNQKALSDREHAAAVIIGDQPKHMVMIGGPSLGGEPASSAAAGPADVATELRGMSSREQAEARLSGMRRAELQALADHVGLRSTRGMSKSELSDTLVERLVGSRLNSAVIRNPGSPAPVSMTAPNLSEGPHPEVVAAKLRGVSSRDEARAYIDGLNLRAGELRRLARETGVPVSSNTSRAETRRLMVEFLAGRRIDADAITGNSRRDKAAEPDPKGQAPKPSESEAPTGAPQPPADDRWPGWAVDLAIAVAVGAALMAALTRGLSIRAVARAAANTWPSAPPSTGAVRSWLRNRYEDNLASLLTPAVEDALAQGYLVGERSARAILDAGVDAREPGGISLTVDWSHWRPGDSRSARAILSADGMTVELQKLLDRAGVTVKGIAAQRLDELAAVLADGLERGESPGAIATALRGVVANPSWANTVAWTETARAQSAAASEIYRQRGVARNEWMTAHDQRVCPLCAANDAAGPVDVGLPFPSGDVHPPGHPRCRCALIPVVAEIGKSARAVATGHEADAERLRHYWTRGEGLAKWADSPHPFRTLRRHLAKYIPDPDELNRTTASWYHDVFHQWPGQKKRPV